MDVAIKDLTVLAFAVAAISVTVTKAHITERMREWVKPRSRWLYSLVTCPYCFAHHVAFWLLVIRPVPLLGNRILDLVVETFALVAVSTLIVGGCLRALLWHEAEMDALRDGLDRALTALKAVGEQHEDA